MLGEGVGLLVDDAGVLLRHCCLGFGWLLLLGQSSRGQVVEQALFLALWLTAQEGLHELALAHVLSWEE